MFRIKSKIITILSAFTLLAGCGTESSKEDVAQRMENDPRSFTADEFMPISNGLQEYSLWYVTDASPTRESIVKKIIVTDKNDLTFYDLDLDHHDDEDLLMEEVVSMSDQEIIEYAQMTTEKGYEKMLSNRKLFDIEKYSNMMESYDWVGSISDNESISEDDKQVLKYFEELKPMDSDIQIEATGNYSIAKEKYTLDLKLDSLGTNTESMTLNMKNAVSTLDGESASPLVFDEYLSFLYIFIDSIRLQWNSPEEHESYKQKYINSLNNYGRFEDKEGYQQYHPQTYVPNSLEWVHGDYQMTLKPTSVRQKLFEQTFAGVGYGDSSSIITKVEDQFVGFTLDTPDTSNKNVTIEGKKL
ncbi:hypothetical protein [Exiguobacterium aurantiacum]|uniref:hypothetical protein n=1 Tax=Exiguobacterium aurantiacum TaxID=33987 RepID=UPI0008777BAF|nr:hypothetical protein [Exiguobacterium aurantiacum]